MAKKDEDGTAAAPVADFSQVAAIIGQAVAQGIQATSPKEIKEGDPEFVARLQAEGFYDTFEKPVYQNSYEAQPRGLSAEVRHRASHLKTGRYIKGRVHVDATDQGIYLRYPIKGDAMLINQSYWKDFSELINLIWEEMHAPVPA